jgi:DNA-binding LacI/PurR family transcriptional regulator/anti-anti-sigma regulatory factor
MVTEEARLSDDRENGRLTIGLAVDNILLVGGLKTLLGVVDVAQERDVNLMCFHLDLYQEGGQIPVSWNAMGEIIDGLVIYQSWPDEEVFASFRDRFPTLPMVNAIRLYEGCPGLTPDSYQGMKELVQHLVETHGYRRIAFVAGPEGNWSGDERYRGYVDALAEYDIPLDPDLVTPYLTWDDGQEAISVLIDERKLLPGTDFEAVAAANDVLALDVLDELQTRGVQVPGDVAVVGFDNDTRTFFSTPPLTTAGYEMGRHAAETLLALLAGERVPERTFVPARVVIRRSCGCQYLAVTQATAGPVERPARQAALEEVVGAQRAQIFLDMAQAVGDDVADTEAVSEWMEQVLDSFVTALTIEVEEGSSAFLQVLEEVLQRARAAGGDVAAWQGALSALRQYLLPYLDGEALSRAESLWQQARVLVGEMARREQASQAFRAEQRFQTLREIGASLIATFDVRELMGVLADGLPHLDIPSTYLALYEDAQPYTYSEPSSEWSRLMLAYDEAAEKGPKRVELEAEGRRFRTQRLMPEGILPDRRYSFVVEPLYFQEHQLGVVLFEVGPREGMVYDVLRVEISSALQGALLLQELERAYTEVEQQVAERTAELKREQEESAHLQQEVIKAQQRAIQELSTPIIPVLEGVIVMPLIGAIDTLRARDVTRSLLEGIREHHAKVVILDITGVPIVDSGVAAYLNKTIQAARLKGARTIVTGVSDAVAETIVDLGIDWSGIETLSDLRVGLKTALRGAKWRVE